MRSSRSFRHNKEVSDPATGIRGHRYLPFSSLRLGRSFVMIATAILLFSLFACTDNSGAYRGALSDCSKALSESYKENVDALKSYVEQDDNEAYEKALAAKKDLYDKFNAFLDVEPSKRLESKKDELESAIKPVLTSLDKVEAGIEVFKSSGEIEAYKSAFEENFKIMNSAVEDINAIFATMKEEE